MLTIPYPKPKTPEEAVANGVAWLDKYVPDWWNHIEVKELDLSSTCKCVLGQLIGNHSFVVEGDRISPYDVATGHRHPNLREMLLRGTRLRYTPIMDDPTELGFDYRADTELDDEDAAYSELSRLWTRVINGRRSLTYRKPLRDK